MATVMGSWFFHVCSFTEILVLISVFNDIEAAMLEGLFCDVCLNFSILSGYTASYGAWAEFCLLFLIGTVDSDIWPRYWSKWLNFFLFYFMKSSWF